ncbi:cyclin-D4-2 [Euphorbia lathyris]|uniref:cyclin-D4-2 n=1 Tax=Euphorbia lathyris TaxID=212925 RepID=UPI0033140385
MGENLGLLCAENTNTCFGDFDCNATLDFGVSSSWHKQDNQEPFNCLKSLMGFPIHSEDTVREMVEREIKHLPRQDYLRRLRSGDLELSTRREALDWIIKAQTHYNFGAVSVCLSMNYFDRFLSVYQLPDKAWAVQLLAVACLSVAAKMEEISVPFSVDLQVGEPKFVFEAKTIQRMELLLLFTLKWRMQAITPCSYLDYFLSKMNNGNQNVMTRSLELIVSIIKGIDFLEFRPSEIAAAVAIFVSGGAEDQAVPGFTHIEKDRVIKIIELIKDLSVSNADKMGSVPESPNGVLEAASASACLCLSYKSDDITTTTSTVGSCANSSSHKRRKLHNSS